MLPSAVLGLVALVAPLAAAQPHFPFERERAPTHDFYEFFPICSADSYARMIAIEQGGRTPAEMIIHGINGTSGEWDWIASTRNWWNTPPNPAILRPKYLGPARPGWPSANAYPWWGNIQPTVDLDADGYCDYLSYGWDWPLPGPLPYTTQYDWYVGAYSGLTGETIWEWSNSSLAYDDGHLFWVRGFPTGMFVYNDLDPEVEPGARFVLKTTNTTYDYDVDFWLLIQDVYQMGVSTTGSYLWTGEYTHITGGFVRTSRITGVGEVQGDREMEVYVEHFAPDDNETQFIAMSLLKGDLDLGEVLVPLNARVLWGPQGCYLVPPRGNDPRQFGEEPTQQFLFAHHRIIDDVDTNGEGDAPEAVCTYLTISGDVTSVNGRFQTHVQPLRGETGQRFWPKQDIKQQGYGYVGDLNEPPAYRYERWGSMPTGAEPDQSNQLIGFGTVDLRQAVPRGSRFPPKETRLTTLKVEDGTPIWGTHAYGFVQNDFLALEWTLLQYAQALAGHDYTGDGVRELISAARYKVPGDKEQELLSTIDHDYAIVDGRKGKTVKVLDTWGPRGMILGCWDQAPDELTALAGHARRLDVTRWNGPELDLAWREPYYLNARAQAQTAGVNLRYVMPRCGDVPDGRSMFGWIQALVSLRRGFEELGVYGFENATGQAHWIKPELPYKPPLNASLAEFLDISEPPPSLKETVGMSILSVTGGVGAAFGSVALSSRVLRRRAG